MDRDSRDEVKYEVKDRIMFLPIVPTRREKYKLPTEGAHKTALARHTAGTAL